MIYPPEALLLLLPEPRTTGPVHDTPRVIVRSPRRRRLRGLAVQLTRRRPMARPTGSTPVRSRPPVPARKTASPDR
jgi:hypothetical protein